MFSNRRRTARMRLAARLRAPIRGVAVGGRLRDQIARTAIALGVATVLIAPSIGSADPATARVLVKFNAVASA